VGGRVARLADAVEQVEDVGSRDPAVTEQREEGGELVVRGGPDAELGEGEAGEQFGELAELDQRGAGIVEQVALGLRGVSDEERRVRPQEVEVRRVGDGGAGGRSGRGCGGHERRLAGVRRSGPVRHATVERHGVVSNVIPAVRVGANRVA
jgi:hypothetical protein